MSAKTLTRRSAGLAAAALLAAGTFLTALPTATPIAQAADTVAVAPTAVVEHKTVTIDGLEIFYREAGDPSRPTILLLHGFPTSSQMFRNLIPELAERYHVLAPDYPGYGRSSMPAADAYDYTFANLAGVVEGFLEAKNVESFALYLMDYGAPVGFRVFANAPERVTAFIVQNGNAYDEGLQAFWDPIRALWKNNGQTERDALRPFLEVEATEWQYTHGVPNPTVISPDAWITDQYYLDRPGNQEIQLDLFYDYRTNVDLYPSWQALFREHQPPTLITWGKGDVIFPEAGAHPYTRDLENVELHILDAGHFALESHGAFIAAEILDFLDREVDTAGN
ncbi:MAG: alpha/beta hydrolase [Pseudomonadota bacterium]